MEDVHNKTIVVTGGASGIGFHIVEKFLEKGANFVIILDISENNGETAAKNLTKKFGANRIVFMKCDVRKDLEKISEEIFSKFKSVDVLVNNAGWARENSVRDTFELNTFALIEWTQKFYEHMSKENGGKGGAVVNIASMMYLAYKIIPFLHYYTASKFAVVGFTRSIGDMANYEKSGVRVVAVCPGFTKSNIFDSGQGVSQEIVNWIFENFDFQDADVVGNAVVEVFQRAESGTLWSIVSKSLEQLP